MDNYSLKLFLDLTESLNFGRTGRSCNISPSALSRQIQRIEDEVGERLFERDRRSVKITPAGVLFREYAGDTLKRWNTLQNEIAERGEVLKGEISLYCSVTASYSILPVILRKFRRDFPNVHIKLQTGDAASAVEKITEGEADIAVAALPDNLPADLMFKVITQTALVFIAPLSPWEYSEEIDKNIVWNEVPMIVSEKGLAKKRVDSWFKEKGIKPNIYAEVLGNEALLAMVSLGCGIGVVPELVVEKSLLQKHIKILNIKPRLTPYSVGVCVQKKRIKSLLISSFWDRAG